MSFNSIEFIIFLPIVFAIYWSMSSHRKAQNLLLLFASYFFYGWWDWRFLVLIFISSFVDYSIAFRIKDALDLKDEKKARIFMMLSVFINLGILGFFKYYNFFVLSFVGAFAKLGIDLNIATLKIILPVGISFYTFQTMSYTIDIFRQRIKPTKDWVVFFTFVSFFPQLVAGPIERASSMIPQFHKGRKFNYAQSVDGFRYILYGLFKKIVIADHCAAQTYDLLNNYQTASGSDLFLGMYVFNMVQFYCDFSAYSDIAIGVALLFGFKLSRNFAYPIYSRNIEEVWQRWHMTLSKWFRDYMYLSMARTRWKKLGKNAMLILMFTAIGLWHGSEWTFISWGFYNGVAFVIYIKYFKTDKKIDILATKKDIPSILKTDLLVAVLLSLLVANSMTDAIGYFKGILSPSLFSVPSKWAALFWPFALVIWEWHFRDKAHGLALDHWKRWQRWSIYLVMLFLTFHYYGVESDFIYYQF